MRARGRRLVPLVVASALLVGLAGCESRHPPDEVLRDSLGLEGSEEVHRVSLAVRDGRETAVPPTTEITPGALVEFVSGDRFVRMVEFREGELSPEGAEFLQRTGQLRSAPLLDRDARFVVSFRDAPAGRYPYRAEGNYGVVQGVVVVRAR